MFRRTVFIILFVATSLSADSTLIYPWVTNTALFTSKVIINNLGETTAQIRLEAIRPDGHAPQSETVDLDVAALSQLVVPTQELFPGLGLGSGFMVVLTSQNDDLSGAFVVNGTGSESGTSPAQADVIHSESAQQILLFNYLSTGAGFDASAPVVLNPGNSPAQVLFHAFQDGQLTANTTRFIQPRRPFAETSASMFPDLQGEFFLVAESDVPILGVAFLFNQFLEPAMANVTPLDKVPANPTFEPYVDTFLQASVAMDGFVVDDEGNIYGAGGWLRDDITKVTANGHVSTLATGLNGPVHVLRADSGTLYVSNFNDGTIKRVASGGLVESFASGLNAPVGMAFDQAGNLIVCEYGAASPGKTLAKVASDGSVTTFTNDQLLHTPIDILANQDGSFYVANQVGGRIMHVDGQGQVSEIGSLPSNLGHMVFLTDRFYATGNNHIYQMDLNGNVSVLTGSAQSGEQDGPLESATFRSPNGIAIGPDQKTLYIASATRGVTDSTIRRIHLFP